jgi:hypothetical protein
VLVFGASGNEFAGGFVELEFYCTDGAGHAALRTTIESDYGNRESAESAVVHVNFEPDGRLILMPNPATCVQAIHFEDFDGTQFERLVFAFHVRIEDWKSLEWYGQAGSDLGRDIWGVSKDGEAVCIQCVNGAGLTFAKIRDDLSKVLSAANGVPYRFRIVTRSDVSASMRDKINAHVRSKGVAECDIWSGKEFEEFLRHRTVTPRSDDRILDDHSKY